MIQLQYTPYILPLLAAAAITGTLALYAWRHRRRANAALEHRPAWTVRLVVAAARSILRSPGKRQSKSWSTC